MFGFGIGEIVGGITAVGGVAYGFWKGKQLKNLVTQTFEFIVELRKARDAASEGGKEITTAEMDALIEEAQDMLKAAVPLFSWIIARKG